MFYYFIKARERFEKEDAFTAITTEAERVRIFNEWIEQNQSSRKKKDKKKHKKRSGSVSLCFVFLHTPE